MSIVEKIAALFEGLQPSDLHSMPPSARRRFAELCRHWAKVADNADAPKAGVLSDLQRGARAE